VLETIRDLGLELQVIFNKGAVMILPSGVNKATGLAAALELLCLSPHNVVAVGDAENDHALCQACEASAAVANALPTLKDAVDIVLASHHGGGVEELIERVLADDLQSIEPRLARHHLLLGHTADGQELRLPPFGANLLVTGPRGGGKSSLAAAILDRLAASRYQFCLVDPDGSYEQLAHATAIGHGQERLDLEAVVQLLSKPSQNAHVSLASLAAGARQSTFVKLMLELERLRHNTGRPHWILVDDAEHLLPAVASKESVPLPAKLDRVVLITETARRLSAGALAQVDTLAVVGNTPQETLNEFCEAAARTVPSVSALPLPLGEVLYWRLNETAGPIRIRVKPALHSADTPADAPSVPVPPAPIRPPASLAR
jgi:hypothetical protein